MKTQSRFLLLGITSTLSWVVSISPSSAVNFIGNLPSNDVTGTVLRSTGGTNVKAVSFSYGNGQDYSLDNVVLRLDNYDSSVDSFSLQIRNDVGDANPGSTVLTSFSLPVSQGSGSSNYTFNPNSSFTFQQNTKYWLYLNIASTSGGTGAISWMASSPGVSPLGVAAFGAYRFSNDGGGNFGNSSIYNSFQINATAVPEPLTILGAIAAVGFGSAFKRRSNKSQDLSD